MTDNQLIELFIINLKNGIASEPYTLPPYNFDESFIIQQSNQPTQQGINSSPAIYFNKIHSVPYGFPGRDDRWDPVLKKMVHKETHWYESTFQFMALAIQDPANTNSITASDILTVAKQVFYSDKTSTAMRVAGVGKYRITEIRNPYFLDDYERFESAPSFDITFTYKNVVTTSSPVVESINSGIYPVL